MSSINPLKKSLKLFQSLFKKWRLNFFRFKKWSHRKIIIVLLSLVVISAILFKVYQSFFPSRKQADFSPSFASPAPSPSLIPSPSSTVLPTPTSVSKPPSKGSLIYWSADRKLSWDDFQGRVPDNPSSNVIVALSLDTGWEPAASCFLLEGGLKQCSLRIDKIWGQATVDSQKSWVRDGFRTPDRLDHEQLHFDITELFARKFREQTKAFLGRNFVAEAESEEVAIQQAYQNLKNQIGPVVANIKSEYDSTQDRYDAETAHSRNSETQAIWTQKIRSQL